MGEKLHCRLFNSLGYLARPRNLAKRHGVVFPSISNNGSWRLKSLIGPSEYFIYGCWVWEALHSLGIRQADGRTALETRSAWTLCLLPRCSPQLASPGSSANTSWRVMLCLPLETQLGITASESRRYLSKNKTNKYGIQCEKVLLLFWILGDHFIWGMADFQNEFWTPNI